MEDSKDSKAPGPVTMQDMRERYRRGQEELRRRVAEQGTEDIKIEYVAVRPPCVNIKEDRANEQDETRAIELSYANGSFDFDPTLEYPPSLIEALRSEWMLNARGIYYRNTYSPSCVTMGRKVWVPTLGAIDWDSPGEACRRRRARVMAEHSISNETWNKSEFAWEADAWSDVFGEMRNDPVLAMDKRQFSKDFAQTDPVLCTLTGKSTVIQRIPDATFGLTTFSDCESDLSVCADELRRTRLEKVLLHRKCGLLADPKWGETELVFPFAVYEAKSWSGDCREARRQACVAGATYLDMLDDLARKPGPVGSTKPYQTMTSHHYQVFALTSFGAHWHLLVGYRRPRHEDEHGGRKGMSGEVYIFQKVWSGRVSNEWTAWTLLTLMDQIHQWALTEFRTFVIEHLRAWHAFCDDNYLLDWDSVYDTGPQRKRRRHSDDHDLPLPNWTDLLDKPTRLRVQDRAKKSLERAIREHQLRKGKAKCSEESDPGDSS